MTVIIKRSNDVELRRALEAAIKQLEAAESQNTRLMGTVKMLQHEVRELRGVLDGLRQPIQDYVDCKRRGLWYKEVSK